MHVGGSLEWVDKALFGEGVVPWPKLFQAAETACGVEYYLIEQQENDLPLEAVNRCLAAIGKLVA